MDSVYWFIDWLIVCLLALAVLELTVDKAASTH